MLEERGEDNVLCRDNASPYSCRLPLTHETNGMGASPWSHPNEGVCCEVKWSEVREEEEEEGGGGKCHKKSGSGCSTLAVHHGSSQVNVKTRESFAEYWFNAAARAGGRCALQITCALFPTHTEPWVPLPPHSREPERDRERMFFYVLLPSVTSNCVENQLGTPKQATTALICKTYQAPFVSIRVQGNTKGSPRCNVPPPIDGIPFLSISSPSSK